MKDAGGNGGVVLFPPPEHQTGKCGDAVNLVQQVGDNRLITCSTGQVHYSPLTDTCRRKFTAAAQDGFQVNILML